MHPEMAEAFQHHQAGNYLAAAMMLDRIVRAEPANVGAWRLLGESCLFLRQYNEAAIALRHSLALNPYQPEVHNNLGVALVKLGRWPEAIPHFEEALRLNPDYPNALNNLAVAYSDQRRYDEAAACLERAIRLQPDYAEAHNGLGRVRFEQHRYEEAVASFRRAVALNPQYARALANLAIGLIVLGELDEAQRYCEEALRLEPDNAELTSYLAVILKRQGRAESALTVYQRALEVQPDCVAAHIGLGLFLLLHGDYERGWQEYEWRWRRPGISMPATGKPIWDGSPLKGRTLLTFAEQGLGDTIHFVRFAQQIQASGARVVVQAQPVLVPLLREGSGLTHVVGDVSEAPPFDVMAPLTSLPRLLGTRLESIPAPVPYLQADPRREQWWKRELDRGPGGLRVAIAWQGNPHHQNDRARSVRLERFRPLALAGVRLLALQWGHGREQLPDAGFPVEDWGERVCPDFRDQAAFLRNVDLVISVDTSLVHLAGALAVPTWVALPFNPDWRWLMEREDSPWYPTLRLVRQPRPGDWDGVFDRLRRDLESRLAGPRRPA
ncbi:MAG: tetratricopeptide repeat-containing glycosyltransferase family protein [Gemmataceae bacterium]|nr:tetratricopeptide repeat-containing glycosyltransferase family protein [Gemmataceae bacterium]MDW8265531.1 tetratricopeptide repeat-containing glycosyltransferase family protein [Gemmataceae bacterium]